MKHLAEIISQLPPDYRTIVVIAFVCVTLALTVYGVSRSARNQNLPLGVGSGLLSSIALWTALLPIFILALLLLITIGVELWKEFVDAVQSAPN